MISINLSLWSILSILNFYMNNSIRFNHFVYRVYTKVVSPAAEIFQDTPWNKRHETFMRIVVWSANASVDVIKSLNEKFVFRCYISIFQSRHSISCIRNFNYSSTCRNYKRLIFLFSRFKVCQKRSLIKCSSFVAL